MKVFTLTLSIILVLQTSFSQDSFTFKKYGIGLRQGIGYNFQNNSGSTSGKTSWLNPTLLAEYRPHRHISIQSEIQYLSNGFKESLGDTSLSYSFNFVQAHLLGKIRLNDDADRHTIYIVAGSSIGYFLNGNIESSLSKANIDIDKTRYNTFSFAAIVGTGYSYRLGNIEFHSDIRANMGIHSIDKITSNKLILNQFSLNVGAICFF